MCHPWSEPFGRFALSGLYVHSPDDIALNMVLFPAVTYSQLTSFRGFTPRDYISTTAHLLSSLDLLNKARAQSINVIQARKYLVTVPEIGF